MKRLGSALRDDLPRWRGDGAWRISTPTTILHGRLDASVPVEASEAFASRNPSARLHILEDDHSLLRPASLALLASTLEEAFR